MYVVVGLLLSSILLSTCATVFIGVYSYISTYLGKSEETLILTQSGTGNFIATRYISMQVADSAEYLEGVTLISPETLTPCMINEKSCFVRGILCDKFYTIENLTLESGRALTDMDLASAFLGSRAASRLHLSVGDSFIIYSGLRDVVLQMTVIGIFSSGTSALNDELLIPLFAGQFLSGNYPDRINYIRVKYNESIISRANLENLITYQHTLKVQFRSNETNVPIRDGRMDIYDINKKLLKTAYSDSLGETSFSLDFGNYTLAITYNNARLNSSLFLQTDSELVFKIPTPLPLLTLNVHVLGESRESIPFSTVIAWRGSEIIQMRQTNINGEINFSLPSNIYQISTLFWNNQTQESIEFQQNINLVQNASLIFWYHRFKLAVRTFDPSSGIFHNATVEIKLLNGTQLYSGETGSLGYKEFQGLLPTTYNVSIQSGAVKQFQIIKLRSDRTLNFEVLPQFNLQIHVFNDTADSPIANANVQITDSKKLVVTSKTGIDGVANFLLDLGVHNISVQAGDFIKNRIITLNQSRNETFWMPLYNLTIVLTNISGILQNNINVSISSSSLTDSRLTENGLVTFFIPPDSYNIIITCSNVYISKNYTISDPITPFAVICPPYFLTVRVLNGTAHELPALSGINVSIFDNATKTYLTSGITVAGLTNFLLDPGVYNVSVNVSGKLYSKLINFNKEYYNLTFYSYPYNLTIVLFNGSTSLPQPNLQVQLFDTQNNLIVGPGYSDINGRTSFLVNPMIYKVSINNSNSIINKTRLISSPNTVLSFEFPPYNLTIVVLNASSKIPIQNALIQIQSFVDNSTLYAKFTSLAGSAQFDLNPGKYYINLSYYSYNFIELKEIKADPKVNYLIPPYNVSIFVADYWGNPIENASVNYNGTSPVKTDELGYAHFLLEPNFYNITVSYNNLTEFRLINIKYYQESFRFTITLVPRVALNISVVNAINNVALTNISVQIIKFLGDPIENKLTDQAGLCQFYLQQGVYNISIASFKTGEYQLINLSLPVEIIFSIIPSYSLSIFTFDDSPSYFSKDVAVQIRDLNGQLLTQSISNNYGLCTFHLEYGTYNVTISKGHEQKWKVMDIIQDVSQSFHVAPYKLTIKTINSSLSVPIQNARITILTLTGETLFSNFTNHLGLTEFLVDADQYYIFLNISKYSWVKQVDVQQTNTSVQITFSVSITSTTKIEVGDPSEYSASLIQQTLGLTESVVYLLAIILTILVSFSIMNVVSSCVSESRKFIGILRSIGASNGQLYYIINFRISLISFVAGMLGGLLGIMLGSLISMEALEISLNQILTFELLASLISLSIGITILIGFISSNVTLHRLLKMPPAMDLKEILPNQL